MAHLQSLCGVLNKDKTDIAYLNLGGSEGGGSPKKTP